MERDAVIRPDRVYLQAQRLAQARGERERPRCVHARAERRQDAETPVADLVAEALDDDGAIGGNGTGRCGLFVQEPQQVARGTVVEQVLVAKTCERLLLRERYELARRFADRLAELVRAA